MWQIKHAALFACIWKLIIHVHMCSWGRTHTHISCLADTEGTPSGKNTLSLSSFLGWIFCWSIMTGREAVWSFHCARKEKHLLCSVLCRRHWYPVISFIDLGLTQGVVGQVFSIHTLRCYYTHKKKNVHQSNGSHTSTDPSVNFWLFSVCAWLKSSSANVLSDTLDRTQGALILFFDLS